MEGYKMNFNQDFTSISVLNDRGFRLFTIKPDDEVDEIFAKPNNSNGKIRLVQRLFNSSLVVLVTEQKPNCLKMMHFQKKQDIINIVYPTDILCVRMNRLRLVVCLLESIHIHDIRDVETSHSIKNIAPNHLGLCSLSLKNHLAYPIDNTSGVLRIFDAKKLSHELTIKAHNTPLSNLNFSPNGTLLGTASERGTVIRVFCVKNGQRVQEFRRGVKRCVRIASLVFSTNGGFMCVSSNTETVHIFKINQTAVAETELKPVIGAIEAEFKAVDNAISTSNDTTDNTNTTDAIQSTPATTNNNTIQNTGGWADFFTIKTVTSYLIPTQVSDVLSQDRAFATATLTRPGLKHVCGLLRLENVLKLLFACEDGFLYIYEFDAEHGGPCSKQRAHDLRNTLEGVIELNLTETMDKQLALETPPTTPTKSTIYIENPEPVPDNSYAGILKGAQAAAAPLSDSLKYRRLCDAIDTPKNIFDERQFPPVAIAARD